MKLKIDNVRLAFPSLFEARTVNGQGSPAYSASFIIPKDHPQVKEIEGIITKLAEDKWSTKAKAMLTQLKASDKTALHNGDTKSGYNGFAGNYYISCRSKTRPVVLDKDKSPLTSNDGKPYAGSYVNASIEFWVQDNQYGKRINASLRGVQFVKDGDAFSGSSPASEDEFEVIDDEQGVLL